MALNSRGAVDPRWLTHNRAVGYALQLATVEVYNQASSSQTYNASTNTWSGSTTTIYSGPARIQPLNSVTETSTSYDPSFVKTIRVQLPYNKNTAAGATGEMPDIRPNYRLKVTSSQYEDSLTSFVYIVTDVLNSSNAWERTLVCKVDSELDPTVIS